jgi:alkylation response protein AidB-like acyl-CoA dehydrogenase
MPFVHSEEHESIVRTARELVRSRAPVAHLRALRDAADPIGLSRPLWREFARLGFAGICLPDEYGGAGLGMAELCLVAEQCGRTLAPTPLLSTVALSASALGLGQAQALARHLLPRVAGGELVLGFACDEGPRFSPAHIMASAERTSAGYAVCGDKSFVLDGHIADAFVVVARRRGALGLYLVPAGRPGIEVTRLQLVDSRNAARVRFDRVEVPESHFLGGPELLARVLDRGTACLAAEMLGGLQETFEQTIAYLKVRKQFGVPIGSFQALKHRAAAMFCEVELAKSVVPYAAHAIDADKPERAAVVSAAKARVNDAYLLIANEAVQMHGGIGVTDELDIGLFLKRAQVAAMTLGTSEYHRRRFASHLRPV